MCRLTESTAKYKKAEKHNSPRLCVNVSFILAFLRKFGGFSAKNNITI